jgi:TRAP-type uncharacterized transport system fused permease subunit
MFQKTTWLERIMLVAAGLLLVYPATIGDVLGLGLAAAALASQLLRRRRLRGATA